MHGNCLAPCRCNCIGWGVGCFVPLVLQFTLLSMILVNVWPAKRTWNCPCVEHHKEERGIGGWPSERKMRERQHINKSFESSHSLFWTSRCLFCCCRCCCCTILLLALLSMHKTTHYIIVVTHIYICVLHLLLVLLLLLLWQSIRVQWTTGTLHRAPLHF